MAEQSQNDLYILLARIDERTISIERRLDARRKEYQKYVDKLQSLPCEQFREKLKTHDRLIWGVLLGLLTLVLNTFWELISK